MSLSSQSGVYIPCRRKTLNHKKVNAEPRSSVFSVRPVLTIVLILTLGLKSCVWHKGRTNRGKVILDTVTSDYFSTDPSASRDGPVDMWPEP